jgi:choline dehydrogenase-like flavoprotein
MRDVIVIGSGAGGAVAAKELAARGLDVLVLEAGRWDTDDGDWSHYENDCNNPADGYFRFGPGDRAKPSWFREFPQDGYLWQLSGVGGTTQHYFGNSPRAMPGVFNDYAGPDAGQYDVAHRFPFGYRDLIPYYEWVEATLPVKTAPMGRKERIFFDAAAATGLPVLPYKDILYDSFRPQENAILQPEGTAGRSSDDAAVRYPQASGCTLCGYCFQGCNEPKRAPINLKAKRSTNASYAPMALTADAWTSGGRAATLVTNAFATQILYDDAPGGGGGAQAIARGVRWRDTRTNELHEETARVVVLSAGATESPRLWLNSALPNPNDWVGRGYTDHFLDFVIGVFDHDVGNSKGPNSNARADFPGRGVCMQTGLPPGLEGFTFGFSDSGVRGLYDNGRGPTGAWDGKAGRVMGNELKEAMSDIGRLMNILCLVDDDVEPENRVTRSVFPPDEHGPVAKLTLRHRQRTARTVRNREFLTNKAAQILRAAGARKVYRMDFAPLPLHVHSSLRMGHDPADSVLDASGEARWVDGLYVCDNAALANALGGPNPTLTDQAVTTRTVENLFVKHFGGDPWVGAEAPVSSIDDRVTAAVLARAGSFPS